MDKISYRVKRLLILKSNIKMIKDILEGKIDNYTKQPLPILRDCLTKYQEELSSLEDNSLG